MPVPINLAVGPLHNGPTAELLGPAWVKILDRKTKARQFRMPSY